MCPDVCITVYREEWGGKKYGKSNG
jgi:hypothetical protein